MKLGIWGKSAVSFSVGAAFLSATSLAPLIGCATKEAERAEAAGQGIVAEQGDDAIAMTADGARMYSWNGFDVNVYPNGDAHAVYTYADGTTLQARIFANAPDGNIGAARIDYADGTWAKLGMYFGADQFDGAPVAIYQDGPVVLTPEAVGHIFMGFSAAAAGGGYELATTDEVPADSQFNYWFDVDQDGGQALLGALNDSQGGFGANSAGTGVFLSAAGTSGGTPPVPPRPPEGPIPGAGKPPIDPITGKPPVDPITGKPPIDPITGKPPIDPITGKPPVDPITGKPPIDPITGKPPVDPITGKPPVDPITGKPPVDPITGKPPVDPVTGKPQLPIDPVTGKPVKPKEGTTIVGTITIRGVQIQLNQPVNWGQIGKFIITIIAVIVGGQTGQTLIKEIGNIFGGGDKLPPPPKK